MKLCLVSKWPSSKFFLFFRTCLRGSLWNYWHPLGVLDTGRKKNILIMGNVKREDWTGRGREKVGQLSPSTETGAAQGWAMVDSWRQLYSFNRSINDCVITLSHGPTKKRYRIGLYQWQIPFIELPKIKDWINLSSSYHNLLFEGYAV